MAWWLTAWLRGHEVTDHVLAALTGDEAHVVTGLAEPGSLFDLLVHARGSGADHAGLALPVEGDPLGLGGPRALNDAALEAGEAVVLPGLGLVPSVTGSGVEWTALPAQRRHLPDVGEADRGLRSGLTEVADRLADLDVARWRPEVADALMDLHRPPAVAVRAAGGAGPAGLVDRGPGPGRRRRRALGVRGPAATRRADAAGAGGAPGAGRGLLARGVATG